VLAAGRSELRELHQFATVKDNTLDSFIFGMNDSTVVKVAEEEMHNSNAKLMQNEEHDTVTTTTTSEMDDYKILTQQLLTLRIQSSNPNITVANQASSDGSIVTVQCYPYQTTVGDLKQLVLESMLPTPSTANDNETVQVLSCDSTTQFQPRNDDDVDGCRRNNQHSEETSSSYNVRFIAFGQLLLPDDATLDAFPQILKLWFRHDSNSTRTSTNSLSLALDASTAVGVIHAVITKISPPKQQGTMTTTSPLYINTTTLPFSMALQNTHDDYDDDDELFYHEEDEEVEEISNRNDALFHDDEDDDDDGILEDDPNAIVGTTADRDVDLEWGGRQNPIAVLQSQTSSSTANNSHPTHHSHHHASRNNNERLQQRRRRRRVPLGFDQLRVTAGLNREDIVILRLYFNPAIDRWLQSNTVDVRDYNNNNISTRTHDALRQRRIYEDAWMNAQGPYSEFRLNLNLLPPPPLLEPPSPRNQSPLLALPLPPSNRLTSMSTSPRVSVNFGTGQVTNENNAAMNFHDNNATFRNRASRFNIANGNTATIISRGGILPTHSTTGQQQQPPSNMMLTIGTDRDFVYGFLLGCTVGCWMLLWVWIPTVSYKQKLGILVGYSFHLTMNTIQKSMFPHLSDGKNNLSDLSEDEYYSYSNNFLIDDSLQLGE
jgi:hypothetical protein